MAGFPKVRMLELELFQCLNRQLGYAGRLGVVAIELPLPARGSQTVKQTVTMRSGSVLLAFNRSCPLYSVLAVMGRAGITPPAHSRPNPAFPVSRFLERKGSLATILATCRAAERATRSASQFYALRPRRV
jgi:hypothetical protein